MATSTLTLAFFWNSSRLECDTTLSILRYERKICVFLFLRVWRSSVSGVLIDFSALVADSGAVDNHPTVQGAVRAAYVNFSGIRDNAPARASSRFRREKFALC